MKANIIPLKRNLIVTLVFLLLEEKKISLLLET